MNRVLRDGRQQRLVSCAKEVFAQKGYHSTTISDIVQRAGIARGTFYQYFDNKLHIFQTVLESFLQELRAYIRPVSLGAGSAPPLVQIQDNLTRVLELVLRERDLAQIVLRHTGTTDPALENRLGNFYAQVAEMICRSLDLGMAMRLVRNCDTKLTAYSIIGAVKEVALQISAADGPQPSVDDLVRQLMQFGMTGILAETENASSGNLHGRAGHALLPSEAAGR